MVYLILIFAVLFFYLAWRRVDWGLYLTLFCLPAYGVRFQVFNIPMTVLEAMILILFLVWLVKGDYKNFWRVLKENRDWFIPIGLFLLAATASIFISPNIQSALGIWKAYFLEPILFLIVFLDIIKTKEDLKKVLYSLGAISLVISLFAIFQKISGGMFVPENYWLGGEGQRVTSFYSYPNAIGLFITPIVMIILGFLISNIKYLISRAAKYWILDIGYCLLIIVCGFLAIYFAKSDGAMAGLAAGILFLLLVSFFRFIRQKVAGRILRVACYVFCVLCLSVLVGLAVYFSPVGLKDKIIFHDWSGQTHLTTWKESFEMLKNHWLFGAGLSGYQTAMAPYHQAKYLEIFMYPHNVFLNFWSEMGLSGLLIFMAIVLKFFIQGFKDLNRQKIILMAAMVVILTHGLVDVPYFKNDLAVLWWVVVGLMIKI